MKRQFNFFFWNQIIHLNNNSVPFAILQIILYCFFISVLVVVSAGVQNTQSYTFKKHLRDTFIKDGDRFFNDFMKVSDKHKNK